MCARGLIGSGRWKHRAPRTLCWREAARSECGAVLCVWSLLLLLLLCERATDSAETSFLIPSDYARSAHRGATLALKWTTKINTEAGKSALRRRDDSLTLHQKCQLKVTLNCYLNLPKFTWFDNKKFQFIISTENVMRLLTRETCFSDGGIHIWLQENCHLIGIPVKKWT